MLAKINADNIHQSVHSLTSQYLINLQTGQRGLRAGCSVQFRVTNEDDGMGM